MKNDLISIIVPVYNVEKYLDKCLDSIINQSFSEIEIILVNDGSTDSSFEICNSFKTIDSRIKIINKKNGGLSDARNSGLSMANGNYIVFIDSDDYIALDYIEILYKNIKYKNADVAVCGYVNDYENEDRPRSYKKKLYDSSYLKMSNIKAMVDFFSPDSLGGVMTWNKMYKTSIFRDNNIVFPIDRIHEDNFTTYKLYYYSNVVIYIDKPLYFYLKRPNSIMGVGFSKKSLDMVDAANESVKFVISNKIPILDEVLIYRSNVIISAMNSMVDCGCFDLDIWRLLRSNLFAKIGNFKVAPNRFAYFVAAYFGYNSYIIFRRVISFIKRFKK